MQIGEKTERLSSTERGYVRQKSSVPESLLAEAQAATPSHDGTLGKTPKRVLALMLPASTAMYATYQGILQILMPAQIEAIDPGRKVQNLALVTAVSAFAAAVGVAAGGAISDRTHSRWGRRTPWLAMAGGLSALLAPCLGMELTVVGVSAVYLALWFSLNFYQGALTAVIPDRVPEESRGLASSIFGLGLPFGILLGVNYVARVKLETGYVALALFLSVTTGAFVLFAQEPPSYRVACAGPPENGCGRATVNGSLTEAIQGFFSSFRSADFAYAFAGRMLLFFSFFSVTGYQLYMLQDYIGSSGLPSHSPEVAVSELGTIQTIAWTAAISLAGWLSDRWDRRKLFVGISSIGMALVMLLPLLSATWPAMVIFQCLLGMFFGIFMAVDVALISLVLPDRDAAGRDMGILSIAGVPAIAATVVTGVLIRLAGYDAVFVCALVAALLGGLMVFRIRSVQ